MTHRCIRNAPGILGRVAGWLASASSAVILAAAVSLSLGACDKPKEQDCKRAIENIRKLYGTDGTDFGVSPQAMVRSCRGSASKSSVQCFIAAQSLEDLANCEGGMFEDMFTGEDEDGDQAGQPGAAGEDGTGAAGEDGAGASP